MTEIKENARAKYLTVLAGAMVLIWAIAFTAVAQSENRNSSLYTQYSQTQHLRQAKKRFVKHQYIRRPIIRRRIVRHVIVHGKYIARRLIHRNVVPQRFVRRPIVQHRVVYRPVYRNLRLYHQRVADIGSEANPAEIDNSVVPNSELNELMARSSAVQKASSTNFKGKVDFLYGHDSNLDPSKTGVQDDYYQIDPTLSFSSNHWSGKVSAMMLEYENQTIAQQNQQQAAAAKFSYKHDLTDTISSKTTLDGKYHNEEWPNYIDGPNVFGVDYGFPKRYTSAKLTEALHYNLGSGFTAKTGLYAEHLEASEEYTDWAPSALGLQRFRPSYNQYAAFGEIALQSTPWMQFALKPSITDLKYTERQARQADGTPGGQLIQAPLFETVASELDFDVNFKLGDSKLTPTLQVGQMKDTVYGADNNNYYGAGLKGKIMIDKDLGFYIKPSIVYTTWNFSQFTYDLPANTLRADSSVTSTLAANLNITKNVGWEASYQHVKANSNETWSFMNYSEDVVNTGVVFEF